MEGAPQARLGRRRGGRLVQGVEEVLDGRREREERHRPDQQRAGAHQRLLQQVDHRLHLQDPFVGEKSRVERPVFCGVMFAIR
jgi:hypothetical protein